MHNNSAVVIKIFAAIFVCALAVLASLAFVEHRHFLEEVVLGPGVTKLCKLSDYFPPLRGTANDANVYILDGEKPGATFLILGGSHPEEPAGILTTHLLVENAIVKQGRIIIIIHPNKSASTVTRPGEAYPRFFRILTPWGIKKFRMGDRWANPLDSWPDPETYIHYPSGQMLAYMDIRNLNRTWPGRPNGMLCEQTCYAIMQLIKNENVDLVIDLHEAELEYPVIGTLVAHEKALPVAAMSSMLISASEFRLGVERSPVNLHGLSHREIGDFSRASCILAETPEPFLDRVRGVTDEGLLLTGQDPFVLKAGDHGLLYWPIDENGWPIDIRVGRHCSTILAISEVWTSFNPSKPIQITNVPKYAEVIRTGLGSYFQKPTMGGRVVLE